MLLIVSNKWSKHITDWWKDPSGLGVVSSVTIQAMSQDITIFGTYWPFIREGAHSLESAGSLWNQLMEQYLHPTGSSDNPREYVEGQVSQQMVRRLGREHNTCAIIGDFNGRLNANDPGTGPLLLDLMCSKGWIPFLQTAVTETQLHPVRTYWKGGSTRTCPDHAFVHSTSEQLLTPSGAYVLDGLSELSDGHHILGVAFHVVDGPIPASMAVPKQHHTHRRRPPARPKSQKDLDRYRALLLQWFREEPALDYDNLTGEEAETALQELMQATIDIGLKRPTWGRKLWRTYQDGWSPTLLALQAHLHFIEDLRSHLGNSSRKYRWPRRKCLHEIYKRSKAWEQKVVRAFKRDEDPHRAQKQLGECGHYGPSYYRLLTEPPTLEFLSQERQKVMHQLHGRKRLQASEDLCAYRKFMVGCYK